MKTEILTTIAQRIEKTLDKRSLDGFSGLCGCLCQDFFCDDCIDDWRDVYLYVNNFFVCNGFLKIDGVFISPPCTFTKEREEAARALLNHIQEELKNAEVVTEGR